jgi:small-conductance mechanosensitive channel
MMVEVLEARTLLSGTPASLPGAHPLLAAPSVKTPAVSASVQADLEQISADQRKLQNDLRSVRTTLKADQQAINAVVDALSKTLQPLRAQYAADVNTWRTQIQADLGAVAEARQNGDAAALAKGQATLEGDRVTQQNVLRADAAKIQAVINKDPAVKAAKEKLAADLAPILADQEQLRKDYAQLRNDLQPSEQGSESGESYAGGAAAAASRAGKVTGLAVRAVDE